VILTFPPAKSVPFIGIVKQMRITSQIFVNPKAKNPVDSGTFHALFNRGLGQLPAALAAPPDALYWLEHGKANQGDPLHHFIEGSKIMGQSLKLSARKIQELLAGRMTAEEFWDEYKRPDSDVKNPFLRALQNGFTIASVKLTRIPEADDDLMEFEFSPDVAIGRIVAKNPVPKSAV
jgi:hypothetical protein